MTIKSTHSSLVSAPGNLCWLGLGRTLMMIILGLLCGNLVVGGLVNEEREGPAENREEFGSEPAPDVIGEYEQKYLAQFGYVDIKPNALTSEAELRKGIIRLQSMASLPQTGRLDPATRDKMAEPRCGMTDAERMDPNNPQNFEIGPSKWKKSVLSYRLNRNRLTRHISESAIREDLKGAMYLWETASTLRFVDADTSYGSKFLDENGSPDIQISFERGDHGDGSHFDGPGKVLAHAFSPGPGRGGDVHFDDSETWSSRSKSGTNLLIVAAHELGHSLGLSHSKEKGSLMYPWYAGYVENYQLHPDDTMGIQYLYGSQDSTTTRRMEAMSPTATTAATMVSKPGGVDTCGRLDTVVNIRGEIFAFSGEWLWRMDGEGYGAERGVYKFRQLWSDLPKSVQRIDAAFVRPDTGRIVLFSGKRYYEFTDTTINSSYPNGRPLTDIRGLGSDVTHIDAVFVRRHDQRVYLFSGDKFWKLAVRADKLEVDYYGAYPSRASLLWKDLPFPIDTVFTNPDGRTYFIKDNVYWLYGDNRFAAEKGPAPLKELWQHCNPLGNEMPSATSPMTSSWLLLIPAIICVTVTSRLTQMLYFITYSIFSD